MSSLLPPKKDVALALLERASVFIHLDPRGENVVVPPWLKKQPQLVLQIGLNMAVKIPDLDLAEDAVSCTLSFSRRPHFCYVPWGSVYALVGEDGRGMVWPEDIPPEVSSQAQVAPARPTLRPVPDPGGAAEEYSKRIPRQPTLRPIGQEAEALASDQAASPAAGSGSRRPRPGESTQAPLDKDAPRNPSERPYLRLVK